MIKRYIDCYHHGDITALEVTMSLLRIVNKENVDEFLQILSNHPEVESEVMKRVQEYGPMSNEEYNKIKFFSIGSCNYREWNEEIAARVKEKDRLDGEKFRQGIKIIYSRINK